MVCATERSNAADASDDRHGRLLVRARAVGQKDEEAAHQEDDQEDQVDGGPHGAE